MLVRTSTGRRVATVTMAPLTGTMTEVIVMTDIGERVTGIVMIDHHTEIDAAAISMTIAIILTNRVVTAAIVVNIQATGVTTRTDIKVLVEDIVPTEADIKVVHRTNLSDL